MEKKNFHGAGINPTSSHSIGECLVTSATEAFHICERKINIFKDQNDNWSHFLVPLFGPTSWSHRPTFRGDLVKIGRESKCEKAVHPLGLDPTSSCSGGKHLVRSAAVVSCYLRVKLLYLNIKMTIGPTS